MAGKKYYLLTNEELKQFNKKLSKKKYEEKFNQKLNLYRDKNGNIYTILKENPYNYGLYQLGVGYVKNKKIPRATIIKHSIFENKKEAEKKLLK